MIWKTQGAETGSRHVKRINEWYYPQNPNGHIDATYTTSGEYNIWDTIWRYCRLLYRHEFRCGLPPGGNIFMHFNHAYNLITTSYRAPPGIRRGRVRVCVDGGLLDGRTGSTGLASVKVNGYDGGEFIVDNPSEAAAPLQAQVMGIYRRSSTFPRWRPERQVQI